MLVRIALRLAVAVALAALPAAAFAQQCQARFSNAPCYLGPPNLKLARAFVDAAGGPERAKTLTLLGVLAGPGLPKLRAAMEAKYGADAFAQFLAASDFAMQDSGALLAAAHVPLPPAGAPSAKDGRALFAALWAAGSYAKGEYDYEYMLDRMLGHEIHAKVMDDIDARYGKKADAYYHVIFTALMRAMKGA